MRDIFQDISNRIVLFNQRGTFRWDRVLDSDSSRKQELMYNMAVKIARLNPNEHIIYKRFKLDQEGKPAIAFTVFGNAEGDSEAVGVTELHDVSLLGYVDSYQLLRRNPEGVILAGEKVYGFDDLKDDSAYPSKNSRIGADDYSFSTRNLEG